MSDAKALADALEPFAACAEHATNIRSISAEETWLWKPSQTSRELPGINLAMLLRAAEVLESYRAQAEEPKYRMLEKGELVDSDNYMQPFKVGGNEYRYRRPITPDAR